MNGYGGCMFLSEEILQNGCDFVSDLLMMV